MILNCFTQTVTLAMPSIHAIIQWGFDSYIPTRIISYILASTQENGFEWDSTWDAPILFMKKKYDSMHIYTYY